MRFTNQNVLVTGGGSGIGHVMAQRFAAEVAAVGVVDRLFDRAEQVPARLWPLQARQLQ
jgi:NAD(P)-dependent dehydrogenase (short-subunit alcohol dehydrogenase family)